MSRHTRKHVANELLHMVTAGPCTDFIGTEHCDMTEEQRQKALAVVRASYKLWSQSWIVPKLRQLIPELKQEKSSEDITYS